MDTHIAKGILVPNIHISILVYSTPKLFHIHAVLSTNDGF